MLAGHFIIVPPPTGAEQVPVGRLPTLYAITGDGFAWLCVAGVALVVGIAAAAPLLQHASRPS